jgi:glycosyltransferase involved in cell wall biosynthesis
VNFIFLWRQSDWGLFQRRNEALLWELSKRDGVDSVLHIEPVSPRVLASFVKRWAQAEDKTVRRAYFRQIKRAFFRYPRLVDSEKSVYVYRMFVWHSGRLAGLRRLSDLLLKRQGRVINRRFVHDKDDVVLVAYPPGRYLPVAIEAIRHDLLIADLVDDVIARTEDEVLKSSLIEVYQRVLPKCSWIFSTSPVFDEKYSRIAGREIGFLPNGVSLEPFRSCKPDGEARVTVGERDRKTVGYVGGLNREIDLGLLDHAVSSFPGVEFVLIGFASRAERRLVQEMAQRHANLRFLGQRHFSEIPGHLLQFDVLINLKRPGTATVGNDSMKIYEYLATGKPVVSTPVPPADRFADLIYVTGDKVEFAQYLGRALTEDDPAVREKRLHAARENSWASRADVVVERVSGLLARQREAMSRSGRRFLEQRDN